MRTITVQKLQTNFKWFSFDETKIVCKTFSLSATMSPCRGVSASGTPILNNLFCTLSCFVHYFTLVPKNSYSNNVKSTSILCHLLLNFSHLVHHFKRNTPGNFILFHHLWKKFQKNKSAFLGSTACYQN